MTLRTHLKKSDIAAALGISPPALSRYVRNGCPVTSIEAAREWQRRHVDPTQRQARNSQQRRRGSQADGARDVMQLGKRAMLDELVRNCFIPAAVLIRLFDAKPEDALRVAWSIVTVQHRVLGYLNGIEDEHMAPLFELIPDVLPPDFEALLDEVKAQKREHESKALRVAECLEDEPGDK